MERWQNSKMERTAAKIFVVRLWNLQKTKIFGEQTAAARNNVIPKKIVSGRPEDWTVSGPCHLYCYSR